MAKTFNPNRVGGGTVSIVRAADGTYSLKETGFDQVSSLNMADLGAVATTTTAAQTQTAADITDTTAAEQTKAAFLLPKQDSDSDPFTTEKMLKSAKDLSSSLQGVNVDKGRGSMIDQMYRSDNRFDADTFDDQVGSRIEEPTKIESPTDRVFRSDTQRFKEEFDPTKIDPQVETPQEKLAVTSANVQGDKVPAPGFTNPLKNLLGSRFQTEKGTETRFTRPSEMSALGFPSDKSEVAQAGGTTFGTGTASSTQEQQEAAAGTLGISSDPTKANVPFGTSVDNIQGFTDKKDFISVPAKKTFAQSVTTALRLSPTIQLIQALGKQRNETDAAIAVNKSRFNVVTSSGPMQGRIVGNDGSYDPANNLFHGMNRDSAFGNLNQAGQKRIDTITKTLEKQKARGQEPSAVLTARKEKFERELNDYRQEKADARDKESGNTKTNVTGFGKSGLGRDTSQGGGDTGQDSGGKIVCTMMNESYGFGSFRNKIWMKFHKDLSPEYQKGYHKLFLPLIKVAKKNKIIKNILEHIAVHSTIDMRQSMRGKKHLLGRLYRKILLPICYWVGKK